MNINCSAASPGRSESDVGCTCEAGNRRGVGAASPGLKGRWAVDDGLPMEPVTRWEDDAPRRKRKPLKICEAFFVGRSKSYIVLYLSFPREKKQLAGAPCTRHCRHWACRTLRFTPGPCIVVPRTLVATSVAGKTHPSMHASANSRGREQQHTILVTPFVRCRNATTNHMAKDILRCEARGREEEM
jgi:hypothetical protein